MCVCGGVGGGGGGGVWGVGGWGGGGMLTYIFSGDLLHCLYLQINISHEA